MSLMRGLRRTRHALMNPLGDPQRYRSLNRPPRTRAKTRATLASANPAKFHLIRVASPLRPPRRHASRSKRFNGNEEKDGSASCLMTSSSVLWGKYDSKRRAERLNHLKNDFCHRCMQTFLPKKTFLCIINTPANSYSFQAQYC